MGVVNPEKITVNKSYFDALLRRADFHTSARLFGRPEPANVTISSAEYDALLQSSHEYELLRDALLQGGLPEPTLNLLLSGPESNGVRKDSGIDLWPQDVKDRLPATGRDSSRPNVPALFQNIEWRRNDSIATLDRTRRGGTHPNADLEDPRSCLPAPSYQRQASNGMSSGPEDMTLDDDDGSGEGHQLRNDFKMLPDSTEQRTLFFSGLSDQTTYRDLMSVIKGGKILSAVIFRDERTALVTFVDGASAFLAWAKRNDIYLHAKRIEVKWANNQYCLKGHIAHKITNGATRNILIRRALEKGHTEAQIRNDMEHIHDLVIVDITYRDADAYVSTNSVPNALFARTCMMSRSSYRGCRIEFFRDDCDVPLPVRRAIPKPTVLTPVRKKVPSANRFDVLNSDSMVGDSDQENRTPPEDESDEESDDMDRRVPVSLNFLDSDIL